MRHQALRTQRWKYIHHRDIEGADELYNLSNDPFELHSSINDTSRTEVARHELRTLLVAHPRALA
jgi:arylsulfatase A-like enzyme